MEAANNCQAHKKPIIVYCLERNCKNQKLCIECLRTHDCQNKKLYSLEELSNLVNDLLTKNENLRASIKLKDDYLSKRIPEVIKFLMEEFKNFLAEVEKMIIETGNAQFGSLSLLMQDDIQRNNPDELLKTYHKLEVVFEENRITEKNTKLKEKIKDIASDLLGWAKRSLSAIKSISEELHKIIPKFGIRRKEGMQMLDSLILKNQTRETCMQPNLDYEIKEFELIYRTRTHGDNIKALKNETGDKKPLVFLIEVKETGLIYGIYTGVKYCLKDTGYYEDKNAFIFFL